MSKRDPKRGAKGDYTVGHGKPPLATRFVKGQSGNPSGRPRGKRNLATTLLAVLNEPVTITQDGKRRRITKLEATFKQIVNRAASGDVAAIRVLLQLFPSLERVLAEPDEAGSDPSADRVVLANLMARMGLDPHPISGTEKAKSAADSATHATESAMSQTFTTTEIEPGCECQAHGLALTENEYAALLRIDFCSFIVRAFIELNTNTDYQHNWHIEVLAAKLQQVARGQVKRLMIMVPPRSLKSHCASICLPAFILGHDPSRRILCASYSQDLASQLAQHCRTLMRSPWYLETFAQTRLLAEKSAVDEFMTTRMGARLATSVGGTLTGKGGDYIIIDDPIKAEDAYSDVARKRVNEWYGNTLYSRLNSKQHGAIIVIMQRLHEDDLVGHLLKQEGWEVLAFPAIAERDELHRIDTWAGPREFTRREGEALHPAREPLKTLKDIREQVGEYDFAGQFQQRPAPLGGGIVKREWLQTYAEHELPGEFDYIVQSWDTAAKASELAHYSVCSTWGVAKQMIYLLDVWRKKVDYPELKRAALTLAQRFQPGKILVEEKSSGIQLIQELAQIRMEVTPCKPSSDKQKRLLLNTAPIETGRLRIPQQAPWLKDYIGELITFPRGEYADQVGSTTQALEWIKNTPPEDPIFGFMRWQLEKHGIKVRR